MNPSASVLRNKKQWDELAQLDSCWAILSDPQKKFGRWDLQEFWATGEAEINRLMEEVAELGYPLTKNRALDFGCGIGRLTRHLAKHFDECVGVDISEEMIRKARKLNSDERRCKFVLNVSPNLEQLPSESFDLIYTSIVLQHVPARAAILGYVAEFLRILRPGGLLVMQVPSHIPLRPKLQLRRRIYGLLRKLGLQGSVLYRRFGLSPMSMSCVSEDEMMSFLRRMHASILKVKRDSRAGPRIESLTYFVGSVIYPRVPGY